MSPQSSVDTPSHVSDFIREKGERLLVLLGEAARGEPRWQLHSHGAWIEVQGESADLFQRLVAVQIRAPEAAVTRFKRVAEIRVRGLNRYLESTNTGRVVRTVKKERSVTAIVMRRRGEDPLAPGADLPDPEIFPSVLSGFLKAIRLYLAETGDSRLRFVSAVRLYRVPRQKGPDEQLLALDALNTLVGLRDDPASIEPTALVRGVIGELAEQYVDRGEELRAPNSAGRPLALVKATTQGLQLRALVSQLDDLCAQIEVNHPDLDTVSKWVSELAIGRHLWVKPAAIITTAFVAVTALAWWLI